MLVRQQTMISRAAFEFHKAEWARGVLKASVVTTGLAVNVDSM